MFTLQLQARRAALTNHISRITQNNMGNLLNSPCKMSNLSGRNIRLFITKESCEMDAFITSHSAGRPEDKRFLFRKDVDDTQVLVSIRVLASQTEEVPWEPHNFVSAFVEDENDMNICGKKIIHNMVLSAPLTVLVYDV
ncbi:hypothetical protein KUCAC02_008542 [Chaenocephalus aceratus]|uniref:Uncharacterized protein n=1 Tax=Chaenocephalus aceratus TaxID=36190 RepID=A0ACB9WRD2_CHAAC|nr:hypothetical protein KUCAC02_008542 [Chaenocephalus aceratus]